MAARRLVKVDKIVPYILGANVTTLVDTLMAGLVLSNADAVAVVLAVAGSMVAVSVVIFLLAFDRYERSVLWLTEWSMDSTAHLAAFLAVLVLFPAALLLL